MVTCPVAGSENSAFNTTSFVATDEPPNVIDVPSPSSAVIVIFVVLPDGDETCILSTPPTNDGVIVTF